VELRRFNAGDEVGAIGSLDKLQAARDRAGQIRASIESAAGHRQIANLALDAHGKGRLDTATVVARYEKVTSLDPGVAWDWVKLTRLYRDAGRLPDALRAAEKAAATAVDARDRAVGLNEIGDRLVDLGNLGGTGAVHGEPHDPSKARGRLANPGRPT
jgi:hypothetical protein